MKKLIQEIVRNFDYIGLSAFVLVAMFAAANIASVNR